MFSPGTKCAIFSSGNQDDIIASKVAANRAKDRESLDRLRKFRDYWLTGNDSCDRRLTPNPIP